MKLEDILKDKPPNEIADEIGQRPSNFKKQLRKTGFYMPSINALIKHYPDIDVKDLIMNYPRGRDE